MTRRLGKECLEYRSCLSAAGLAAEPPAPVAAQHEVGHWMGLYHTTSAGSDDALTTPADDATP